MTSHAPAAVDLSKVTFPAPSPIPAAPPASLSNSATAPALGTLPAPQFEVLEPQSRVYRSVDVLDFDPASNRVLIRYTDPALPKPTAATTTSTSTPASAAPSTASPLPTNPACEYVPHSCLRVRAARAAGVFEAPQPGDPVHVRAGCSMTGTILWWESFVVALQPAPTGGAPKVVVAFSDDDHEVVALKRVRPAAAVRTAKVAKAFWDVSEEAWAFLQTTKESMEKIAASVGLCTINMVVGGGRVLEAVGLSEALDSARLALDVLYLRNAKEIARLEELHMALEARLTIARHKKKTGYKLVFDVDQDVIGSCIGRGGANLKKVHRHPGVVAVDISDRGDGKHRVEIVAEDRSTAEAARAIFEHVRARIFVSKDEIGPMIGRRGMHLREIERKSGVSKFVLVERPAIVASVAAATGAETPSSGPASPAAYFETVGTRQGIELATRLLDMHRVYLHKHREYEAKVRKARSELLGLGCSASVNPAENIVDGGAYTSAATQSSPVLHLEAVSPVSLPDSSPLPIVPPHSLASNQKQPRPPAGKFNRNGRPGSRKVQAATKKL